MELSVLLDGIRLKRGPACEDFIQHQTQGVYVTLNRDFPAGHLLRCHVGGCPRSDLPRLDLLGQSCQAEVGDANLTLPIQHNIGRL